VLLAGINDIGLPPFLTFLDTSLGGLLQLLFGRDFPEISAAEIIAAQQQIADAARADGLVVVGATLPPSGTASLFTYCCGAVEEKRQAVNDWIRTSGTFDFVIDFDKVLRDPDNPVDMRSDLTSDGLHPNAAGYAAMAAEAARRLKRSL
jgi:lysophospholipase L1-like esterase